jgi:hypothetical protein
MRELGLFRGGIAAKSGAACIGREASSHFKAHIAAQYGL